MEGDVITDAHVHVQPYEKFMPPQAIERMQRRPDYALIEQFGRSPQCFLKFMDQIGVARAMLINSLPPEFKDFPLELNDYAAEYAAYCPERLLSCGSLQPQNLAASRKAIEQILRYKLRMVKLHPPHQHFYPNDYLNGLTALEELYGACEESGIPIMFHTGTSVFPGARNKYGDPIYLDDVAVDFPKLKIIVAHGGRPLWMDTAFFLVRRHRNVFLEISSIPPRSLPKYFPRLEEIATKTLYGSDWPGPGVPGMKEDLDEFRALPLSQAAKDAMLSGTALKLWSK